MASVKKSQQSDGRGAVGLSEYFGATVSGWFVDWLVGSLTSQQHASVSQGRIREDKFTCCHTEIEVEHQTFYFTQSQYTATGPTSPSGEVTL